MHTSSDQEADYISFSIHCRGGPRFVLTFSNDTTRLLCHFFCVCLLHCELTALCRNNTTLNIKWNLCECIRSAIINLIDEISVNWPMLGRLIYDDTVNPCQRIALPLVRNVWTKTNLLRRFPTATHTLTFSLSHSAAHLPNRALAHSLNSHKR